MLTTHLQAGHHSSGVLIIRHGSTIMQIVAYLELAAYAADPGRYLDHIEHIP